MSVVSVRALAAGYGARTVFSEVSLDVDAGSWVVVIGPNGAGKSTLLRAATGLIPYAGSVLLDGIEASSMPRWRLAQLVAFVPQQPERPAGMSVLDYVLLGRTPYLSYLGAETRHDVDVVKRALGLLDLEDLAQRDISSLSGGEAQRTVLARALAQQARIVFLDEPTTSLDVGRQQDVLRLIDELRHERGLTVLSTMHDLTLAGQFADHLLLLSGGGILAEGSATDVLTAENIEEHYGASVRVVNDPDGGVIVVPMKLRSSDSGGAPTQERQESS